MPLSEARKRANKRWNEKNKDKTRLYQYRSVAHTFIRKHATLDDIEELTKLLKARKQELTQDNEEHNDH